MTSQNSSNDGSPEILDHDLNRHFRELLKFESTPKMEASPLYREIKSEVERILSAVVCENLSEPGESSPPFKGGVAAASADGVVAATELTHDQKNPVTPPRLRNAATPPQTRRGARSDKIKALAWNIERGCVFDGIIEGLRNHKDLKDKDLLLLTELDYGMARSGNRFVAQEIAKELKMNYAFAPVYIALQKGSGVESEMAGENTKSIHGLAMFSRFPMTNVHAIPLPNGKDKMWGKEKRLGHLRALIADIEHPAGTFRAVTIHLDAHCSRAHRHRQMKIILDHFDTLSPLPTLLGGDWNTTTFNAQSARRAILGYWRRVFMGPKNVAKNHLPHPELYFEKDLFVTLERRGYDFRSLNEIGAGTLHYHIESIEKNTNLRDWVPQWCFPFIFWAANRVGGHVSGRLDWFAGKQIELAAGTSPKTIGNLVNTEGIPLSDHDAIALDFSIK